MNDPDDNPFWGEPIPTDLWEDMDKLNKLYEELEWSHRDYLEIAIEGNHITIRNKSREGRQMNINQDISSRTQWRTPANHGWLEHKLNKIELDYVWKCVNERHTQH